MKAKVLVFQLWGVWLGSVPVSGDGVLNFDVFSVPYAAFGFQRASEVTYHSSSMISLWGDSMVPGPI